MSYTVAQRPAALTTQPTFAPGMTWGNGDRMHSYEPGPGGPIPDPRRYVKTLAPGPIFGRVGAQASLRTFGPTIGVFIPWPPIAPWNNSWAAFTGSQQYVPGWTKSAPTATSGF